MDVTKIPDFDDLPKIEDMPQGCAWGIFDRDGEKDVFGTLNLLTPDVVRAAAQEEVRDGVSISLNWPLNGFPFDIPGRKKPEHNVIWLPDAGMDAKGWDDELSFNTQLSSQWDSLCHMHHQKSGLAYNGSQCTKEALQNPTATNGGDQLPTLNHWHSRGGIVGRGVLIDFARYAQDTGLRDANGQAFSPLSGYRITVDEIKAVANHQRVAFKPGDILLVRTGMTQVMENPSPEDLVLMQNVTLSGVHGSEETARWFWNQHFAAVASDSSAFEAFPPLREDGSVGEMRELVLHSYFLAMFGLPIGELWDLKRLSEYCKEAGRYSFMITSMPLNHPGLIASPPNAVAIF